MKKLFTILAVAATLVSCAKEDVVREAAREAIGFDNAFVENSTRSVNDPSFSSAEGGKMFSDFAVYGFVEGAVLLDGVRVAKENLAEDQTKTGWEYEGTQYWIAGANYNFNAVAPLTGGGWAKTAADATSTTLSFTNNGTTDLLYAFATAQGKAEKNDPVAFTFRHTLSKVKLSFENAYNATNATIRVKDVKIVDAYKTGSVVLTGATAWSNQAKADGFVLDFGMATDDQATTNSNENVEVAFAYGKTYESQNELFMIPGAGATPFTVKNGETTTQKTGYTVTFTVELLVSNVVVATYPHTIYTDFAPGAGNSYDLKATINAENIDPNHAQEPIEFTVTSIDGWDTDYNDGADGDNNINM
ncbi:MAG: fimbrillin family protein [Alistipes sp.]|nr:fimbrillin family protein [Alistipes sp.]